MSLGRTGLGSIHPHNTKDISTGHPRNKRFIPILQGWQQSGSWQFFQSLGSRRDPNSMKFLFLAALLVPLIWAHPAPKEFLGKAGREPWSNSSLCDPNQTQEFGGIPAHKGKSAAPRMRKNQDAWDSCSRHSPQLHSPFWNIFSFDFPWKTDFPDFWNCGTGRESMIHLSIEGREIKEIQGQGRGTKEVFRIFFGCNFNFRIGNPSLVCPWVGLKPKQRNFSAAASFLPSWLAAGRRERVQGNPLAARMEI